jgi:hypothetical protein
MEGSAVMLILDSCTKKVTLQSENDMDQAHGHLDAKYSCWHRRKGQCQNIVLQELNLRYQKKNWQEDT